MKIPFPVFTFLVLLALFVLLACKEKEVEFLANDCKRSPSFLSSVGFDPKYSFFSTSDIKTMGLILQQSEQPGNPQARITKTMQHPSWRSGGWLAPILVDKEGNIFTAPAPFISVLDNPIADQNTIYQVNGNTGVMDMFIKLPLTDTITVQNPFGIIGMIILCETGTLYVSTLSGSDRRHERGAIYAIDLSNKKIIDKITGTDAMGLGITYVTGKRQLFFGTGRSSDVFSVTLNEKGGFTGSAKKEFSLEDLGPNGDDKVRRITTDEYGNLRVHGIAFDFNLKPQREKKETIYNFFFDAGSKTWVLR